MDLESFFASHISYVRVQKCIFMISPRESTTIATISNPVMDGVRDMTMDINEKWHFWKGIQEFDFSTKKFQLLEGTKERIIGKFWEYERGKFEFIKELGKWELVDGQKHVGGKKTKSGVWKFNRKKGGMKRAKTSYFCGDEKCMRKSENSRKKFKICGKCEKVHYCSRKHQKRDWKHHKFVCSFY